METSGDKTPTLWQRLMGLIISRSHMQFDSDDIPTRWKRLVGQLMPNSLRIGFLQNVFDLFKSMTDTIDMTEPESYKHTVDANQRPRS